MSTVEKIKPGLDETRMLALGAQVLIGFQFQGVFQPQFAGLPSLLKEAQVSGLLLLIATLGALVVPATQHILVDRVEATRRIETVITWCLDLALFPLALALGLDVLIAVSVSLDGGWGWIAGTAVFFGATNLWLVWGYWRRSVEGQGARDSALHGQSEETPLSSKLNTCSPRRGRFFRALRLSWVFS